MKPGIPLPPTSTPSPEYSIIYWSLNDCNGSEPDFQVTNSSANYTFRSYHVRVEDLQNGMVVEHSANDFGIYSGCRYFGSPNCPTVGALHCNAPASANYHA